MNVDSELRALSPAKINLTLRVGPLRGDGFHPVDSLVTRVDLCDEIVVRAAPAGEFTLTCDDPRVPCDVTNLAVRAASALRAAAERDRRGINRGAALSIAKRIPMGAGLGGGSSNAATTLKLLNSFWRLGYTTVQLSEIGATLGSDVPLFLFDGVCRIAGRGEIVTPLGLKLDAFAVLILPGLHCATPAVYRKFDELGKATSEDARESQLLAALDDVEHLQPLLFNDLEPAAFATCPELGALCDRLQREPGLQLRMSGSGSTLFRLFSDAANAASFLTRVQELGVSGVMARCI